MRDYGNAEPRAAPSLPEIGSRQYPRREEVQDDLAHGVKSARIGFLPRHALAAPTGRSFCDVMEELDATLSIEYSNLKAIWSASAERTDPPSHIKTVAGRVPLKETTSDLSSRGRGAEGDSPSPLPIVKKSSFLKGATSNQPAEEEIPLKKTEPRQLIREPSPVTPRQSFVATYSPAPSPIADFGASDSPSQGVADCVLVQEVAANPRESAACTIQRAARRLSTRLLVDLRRRQRERKWNEGEDAQRRCDAATCVQCFARDALRCQEWFDRVLSGQTKLSARQAEIVADELQREIHRLATA